MVEIFKKYDLKKIEIPKIISAAIYENFLVFGDSKGNLVSYSLTNNKNRPIEKMDAVQIENHKIDSIELVGADNCKLIYALSHSNVHMLDFDLKPKNQVDKQKDILKIATNKDPTKYREIVMVNKKRRALVFEYKQEVFRISQINKDFEIKLALDPDLIQFYGDFICYAKFKDPKLCFYNVRTRKDYVQDCEASDIIYISNSWLAYTSGFGLFMTEAGPKPSQPVMVSEKPFVQFGTFKKYLLSLHDTMLSFYELTDMDNKNLQDVELEATAQSKFLLTSKKEILVVTEAEDSSHEFTYKLWEIHEEPFEDQIIKFTKEKKFDEALSILNINIPSTDPTKPEKIEEYFVNCGWACFKELTQDYLNLALKYFRVSNVNIFELVYVFANLLKVKLLHQEIIKIRNDEEKFKKTQIENLIGGDDKKINLALKFLIDILSLKRNHIMKNFDTQNETSMRLNTIKFTKSSDELTLIDLSDNNQSISLLQILQTINLTLVKAMIKIGKIKDCPNIIDNDECGTNYLEDHFLEEAVGKDDNQDKDLSKFTMAVIYEKQKNYVEALNIYEPFIKLVKTKAFIGKPSKERTLKILKGFKGDETKKKVFEEYVKKLLINEIYQDTFDLILDTHLLNIDYCLDNVIPLAEAELGQVEKNTQERFLKYVYLGKYNCEKFETRLILLYIEKIFKKCGKTDQQSSMDEGTRAQYNSLKDQLSVMKLYNKSEILNQIKDTWMDEVEIYLYENLGKLDLALDKNIARGISKLDLTDAKEFCKKHINEEKKLYSYLFKSLTDSLKANEKENNQKLADFLKKEILDILGKFASHTLIDENLDNARELESKIFEILDPFMVINELPQDWNLEEPHLYEFFNSILCEYVHENNNTKLCKNLAGMDLTYKQKELGDFKKRKVIIDNGTYCDFCRKKIGTTIFVVYPNMKVYHSKCANDPYIDPVSKMNFKKN